MKDQQLFQALGLSDYEAQVYLALMKVTQARVRDLSQLVTVPRPQIYATLKSLLNKGMCTEISSKVSYYSAVSPDVVLVDLLNQKRQGLNEIAAGIKQLCQQYRHREKSSIPDNFVKMLKGRRLSQVLAKEVRQAQKEILVFVKQPTECSNKDFEAAVQMEISALRRGIKVRCLYAESCCQNPNLTPYIKRLVRAGEQARVLPQVPMNMC